MNAEWDELSQLRAENRELRKKLNEVIHIVNMLSWYHEKFRAAFNVLLDYKWYRFLMWVRPFPLPVYQRKLVGQLTIPDVAPELPPDTRPVIPGRIQVDLKKISEGVK